jgi:hypothetical protein
MSKEIRWITAVELGVCKKSDVVSAIQRLDVVALERSVTVPIREGYSPTLEMASNVMENGRVPVYVQGFDGLVFSSLPDLLLEETCKVRGCYQILAYSPST